MKSNKEKRYYGEGLGEIFLKGLKEMPLWVDSPSFAPDGTRIETQGDFERCVKKRIKQIKKGGRYAKANEER